MYPFLAQRKEAMNNNEAKNGILEGAVSNPQGYISNPHERRPLRGQKEVKRLYLDWCTCIWQMQRFTILFLWNKESCVIH